MRTAGSNRRLNPLWPAGLGLLALALGVADADARPPIRRAFFNVYPAAVGSRLDDLPSNRGHCGVCHFDFDGGGPRNPYGLAVQVALGTAPNDSVAIRSIEGQDSDGDGYPSLVEITDTIHFSNTPTFPGLTPGNVGQVLNVDLADIQGYLVPAGGNDTIPPTVHLIAPNGGESWPATTTHTVIWTATDASGVAKIDFYLSTDGGLTFKPVAKGEANDGSYDWFVQNRPGPLAVFRVVAQDSAGNYGYDESDAAFTIGALAGGTVPTTLRDFDLAGTQPLESGILDDPGTTCVTCHGNYDSAVEPWRNWRGSMMAHAARDPLFFAAVAVAEQDAPSAGDVCLRCHTPGGWQEGRSFDTSGGMLTAKDRQSVQCDFCHRMVDPIYQPGVSPPEDLPILDSLAAIPLAHANGQFVTDPAPIRRGPYADAQAAHAFLYSPFHRGALCGTCHDVSNPAFAKGAGPEEYVPNAFDAPHPDGDLRNMFPIERTQSEWSVSQYAATGVYAPQFAGNKPDGIVSICQDCHMHDVSGKGCNTPSAPTRADLGLHDMTGGNTFVPDLLYGLYPAEVDTAALLAGKQRAVGMLQKAATMTLASTWAGQPALDVTVKNETGHKLPSGYPEGRRIWLHVKAYDQGGAPIYESGAYDPATGVLTHDHDLKLYEIEPGVSQRLAPVVGLPAGPSFHFVLNDTVYHDNRIPPRGFTNANFTAVQSPVVDYSYPDSQYWDVTRYLLPDSARKAVVTLYYQATSKEFVEFLRDANETNNAGQLLYDAWVAHGRSAPVAMRRDSLTITVPTGVAGETPAATRYQNALLAAAPNPAAARGTRIGFTLAAEGPVTLGIYDVEGRLVRQLVRGVCTAGRQEMQWDGRDGAGRAVSAGIYFYRMDAAGFSRTRKLVVIP